MQPTFQYKAFLSYSHKDQKEAARLHKALERYRLPFHLLDEVKRQVGPDGALGRVFRDRDELPVADDLTAEVRKALTTSEFMIVLCSPNAAASRWVNKEVIEFKRTRGEAYVLPIVIDGVPGSGLAGSQECFPPGLRFKLGPDGTLSKVAAEPIAADIRKEADGRTRAIQKLIAGLLGIGLDRLVERELQRKQRRVMAITALSMIAMLFMGALTYQALVAQKEAEFQRGQAEDLVEFMLTDLRKKLEPVGRLDVLDSVGDKAVDYYRSETLAELPDDSVGRRARAFHLLGEIEKEKNQPERARVLLQQAMKATGDLLARDPENPTRIFEHAQSVFWVGYLDMEQGNIEAAFRAYKLYRHYAEQLVSIDPENSVWQTELAYSYNNIAALQVDYLDQPEAAAENLRRAIATLEKLVAADTGNLSYKMIMQNSQAWLADALDSYGHAEDVLKSRARQREILSEVLQADPKNIQALWPLMHSYRASGHTLLAMGRYESALNCYRQALEYAQTLVETDPENQKWAVNLAQVNLNIIGQMLATGRLEEAAVRYQEWEGHFEEVLSEDNLKTSLFITVKIHQERTRLRLSLAGDVDASIFEQIYEFRKALLDTDSSVLSGSRYDRYLLSTYLLEADAHRALGNKTTAQQVLLNLWEGRSEFGPISLQHYKSYRVLREFASIAHSLGKSSEYEAIKQSLETRGFQAQK